jgi:hypothetical protein
MTAQTTDYAALLQEEWRLFWQNGGRHIRHAHVFAMIFNAWQLERQCGLQFPIPPDGDEKECAIRRAWQLAALKGYISDGEETL